MGWHSEGNRWTQKAITVFGIEATVTFYRQLQEIANTYTAV